MGETADQTRAEIVQLREEMSEKVVGLRRAAERPVRIARAVAIGAAVVVVVGTTVIIVARARRKPDPARLTKLPEKVVDSAREKLRGEIRKEVEKEMKRSEPMPNKLLQAATRAAATAAVAAAVRQLQDRGQRRPAKTDEGSATQD